MCVKPFSLTKNEGKLFLVLKSSGPLLVGLPLKFLRYLCGPRIVVGAHWLISTSSYVKH